MIENVEEFGTGDVLGISAGLAENAEQASTLAVFGRRNILEIIRTPVKHIAVDVVDLVSLRTRADPCRRHKKMAVFGSELPEKGVMRAVPVGVGTSARPCLRKVWFDLTHDTPLVGRAE